MRGLIVICLAVVPLGPLSAAGGYNPKDAAACFVYGTIAKKGELVAGSRRLATAYRGERAMVAQGEVFMDKIKRMAARDKQAASYQLVSEGRAGCKAIGVM